MLNKTAFLSPHLPNGKGSSSVNPQNHIFLLQIQNTALLPNTCHHLARYPGLEVSSEVCTSCLLNNKKTTLFYILKIDGRNSITLCTLSGSSKWNDKPLVRHHYPGQLGSKGWITPLGIGGW